MSKKLLGITLAAAAAAGFTAGAEVLTPSEALDRLNEAAAPGAPAKMRASAVLEASGLRLVDTTRGADGEPAVYTFNGGEGRGWLVVPADDCAPALLGYATSGELRPAELPCGLRYMLDEYASQITWARAQGAPAYTASEDTDSYGRAPIGPLCATQWDQKAPYNNFTPIAMDNDGFGNPVHCYTGCQATSLAQVMKYYNYPATGNGSITYTSRMAKEYVITTDFSQMNFAWPLMLDTYVKGEYTEEQGDAVATLMEACGSAVQMQYSTFTSATYSSFVPYAVSEYLRYGRGAQCVMRDYFYPAYKWDQFVYDTLAEYGPVLYSGIAKSGGGHAFVCDGYSSEGFFHFNWGWSGQSDGYFLLSALAPTTQGSGGSDGAAYNYDQDIIAGLTAEPGGHYCPPIQGYVSDDPAFQADFTLEGELKPGAVITARGDAANFAQLAWTVTLGVQIEGGPGYSTTLPIEMSAPSLTIPTMEVTNWQGTFTLPALPEGKYVVRPMFSVAGDEDGGYHLMRWPLAARGQYWLTVGADGSMTLAEQESIVEITGFRWLDDHSGETNRQHVSYSVTLTAPDDAYEGDVYAVLTRKNFDTELASAMTHVSIPAGGSVTIEQQMDYARMSTGKVYEVTLYSDYQAAFVLGGPFEFTAGNGPENALESIEADGADGPTAWYTLQGVRAMQPEQGRVYIRVNGGRAAKVAL